MAEIRDNLDIIIEELAKYGGNQKDAAGTRMVPCPFHNEEHPSCGIVLETNGSVPLGFFHCFGCNVKGGWNAFAEKTGLEKIANWNSKPVEAKNVITPEVEDMLLGDSGMSMEALLARMACPEAQDWPPALTWRSFPGELIKAVGGKIIADNYRDSIAVLFPIKMAGRVRGGVKAVYAKINNTDLSYITMSGPWAKKYGLFPWSFTKKIIDLRGYKFVVLVEGPRDALALLMLGIPALAVLGSNNIGSLKATFILSLGVDIVYCMPDGDSGGDKLWDAVKEVLGSQVKLKRFKLPKEKVKVVLPDGTEKLEGMDPGNMPKSVKSRIVNYLMKNNGLRKPKVYSRL